MIPTQSESQEIPEEVTFLSRYYLNYGNLFGKDKNYITCVMRNSIFERILTKILFQKETNEFSLFPLLIDNSEKMNIFIGRLKYMQNKLCEESPLYFFSEVAKEVERILDILKTREKSELELDEFMVNLEYLLAWHFENNFYSKPFYLWMNVNLIQNAQFDNEKDKEEEMNRKLIENYSIYNNNNNYVYSIESINTICQFIKAFERHSLCTRIGKEYLQIKNDYYFTSEKVNYFYKNLMNEEKKIDKEIPVSSNLIMYLLEQLITKIEKANKMENTYNFQLENFTLMNLFLIKKLLLSYSFYLHPSELLKIFDSFKYLKTLPCPTGSLVHLIMEDTLCEAAFQGYGIISKIRDIFFIDFLERNVKEIDTQNFNGVILIYSNEWDKKYKNKINSGIPETFHLKKFLEHLVSKKREKHDYKLILKEFLIKILITFLFNSQLDFDEKILKNIYEKYLPNYISLYENEVQNDENEEQIYANAKFPIDKILKILDMGVDKPTEEFREDIRVVSQKLLNSLSPSSITENDLILYSDFFLPITSFRDYLKPFYVGIKKIYKQAPTKFSVSDKGSLKENVDSSAFDLFHIYKQSFKSVVDKYFRYFTVDKKNVSSQGVYENIVKLRKNFYENFRVKLVVVEHTGTFNELIDNLYETIYKIQNKKSKKSEDDKQKELVSDNEFDLFWKNFVNKKEELLPKFLIHIVPQYESVEQNPFRIITVDDEYDNNPTLLSEYIASQDEIYKNIIFMPFSASCDPSFYGFIQNCQNNDSDVMQFPTLDVMYSFIKKPLDYYISDSEGILLLDLYKISINDDEIVKIFYKNVEFIQGLFDSSLKAEITLYCVSSMGIEIKEPLKISFKNEYNLKFFNLFFKKNVPFSYNKKSNNGWLELYMDDRYDRMEVEKICKYNNHVKINNKFYDELNQPQTDLETRFKNYKISKMILETNATNLNISYDEYEEIKYNSDKKNKIVIEPLTVNGQRVNIPISTFISF